MSDKHLHSKRAGRDCKEAAAPEAHAINNIEETENFMEERGGDKKETQGRRRKKKLPGKIETCEAQNKKERKAGKKS